MNEIVNFVRAFGLYRSASIYSLKIMHSTREWVSYLTCPIVEKQNNNYIITYIYNMKEYKIQCKKNRNRIHILYIKDENDNEISDKVKPFMGPFLDFHGISTSPSFLGYDKLSFHMLNGEKKIFFYNEIISLY